MIIDGIIKSTYNETNDNTLKKTPRLQEFLDKSFYD